ncbi:transposase [Sporosarcina newyorkensis 2681]|uniref:Transposase n=1 Tax=Sporosarcina newyorkensis 2681 TaxID=1027292 RepID=F9DVV7_9BACL|nr:transposase [Sporosarcina newyorkensis 2681]
MCKAKPNGKGGRISAGDRGNDVSMNLDSKNHSLFLLYYHLVMAVKYRRKAMDDVISDYAKIT